MFSSCYFVSFVVQDLKTLRAFKYKEGLSMKRILSRRAFLQGSAAAAAGGLAVAKTIRLEAQPLPRAVAPSDRVRFGMIGIGMQGSGLLGQCHHDSWRGVRRGCRSCMTGGIPWPRKSPEIRVCQPRGNTRNCSIAKISTASWRLFRITGIAASSWMPAMRARISIAKSRCRIPFADGFAMVDAAQKNNRIVQIGSQRVSSVLCAKAAELYKGGAIGDIEMVELTLGRNDPTGAWQYPPPTDLSPQTLDWDTWLNDAPKIPFNKLHFARWRCWRAYGTGVAGDLMVHLLSGMLVTLGWNEIPRSATAMGGIFRFKDGRDMPDFHTVLFDYHGIPVYVRLDLGCETPELARFMGPKGLHGRGRVRSAPFSADWRGYGSQLLHASASRRRCARST